MLTSEELSRAIQSLVDDWKKSYPTPWPFLHWLDEIHNSKGGGVGLWGKFILMVLPSPEWEQWFTATSMFIARSSWGEAACNEEIQRIHYARAREEMTTANRWLHERDDRLLALMRQHWFPDWNPPAGQAHYFPTKGISPTAGFR